MRTDAGAAPVKDVDDVERIETLSFNNEVVSDFEENTLEEKKLVRKIDLYLMPTIWILYLFSYMDRTNIGNAKVAGMNKDIGLSDNQYSMAIILFQVAYVIFGVPSNMVLSRVRPSIYVPALMFLWGAVVASLAAVKTPAQLLGVRFLLGIMEAGFSPAVLFIISTWYRRHEQSKRFVAFLSAGILSGAFAGILAGVIAKGLNGAHGVEGWRWLFIVEGVITCGLSFIAPFFLLDYPATSKQLTPEQRILAVRRMEADGFTSNSENERTLSHLKAFWIALTDGRLWVLIIGYMTIIGAFSLSYFYPTLVSGLGYSAVKAQFMTAPLYVVAFAVAVPVCILADRIPAYRAVLAGVVLVCGSIFCALSAGIQSYVPRYVFLCFINTAVWTANPLALSFASSSLGPVHPEVRAIGLAMINGGGNLAQVYGSYLFPGSDAPRYLKGFCAYTGILFFGAATYVCAYFIIKKRPFKPTVI